MDAGLTLGLGGLIATLVALVKAGLPGTVSPRTVWALVLAVSAGVVVLAFYSGMLVGLTPFAIVTQWAIQAATAVGLREGLVAAVPQASALPSR